MPAVYISYPFCGQKCTYCNFASGVFPRSLEERYRTALLAEIGSHTWRWRPETLYLGGGTPGDIEAEGLEAILAAVPGHPWLEATIEAAPGSIARDLVDVWWRLGINRVSLGVQSFIGSEIARTGRKHTADTVRGEVALLRNGGITNINIDLVAGLAEQTLKSWSASLDWIERLAAPHVSVYMFELDEDSRLGREILQGGARYGARDVPSDDRTAEMYETAVERLRAMGLERYEISNFALPGHESRHNLKYWRLEPYTGFGADAHSFDGDMRRQNVEAPQDYTERVERGESPCIGEVRAQAEEERFFVGLRLTAGIRPRPKEWQRFERPIRRFLGEGLLETDGETLRLTPRGILVSNEVFQEFVNI